MSDMIETIAARLMSALRNGEQIPPMTSSEPGFDLAAAKRVSARVTALRRAEGEVPVGVKIGFTNKTIWDEYGVHAPIHGPMYNTTLTHIRTETSLPLKGLMEPRIEPEIAFRFARAPTADMDEIALIGCLDGIGHGMELVQSVYPGWRFQAADTIAAFALHGAYALGPVVPMPGWRMAQEWRRLLDDFSITLFRDDAEVDTGVGENVLGGPLTALKHYIIEAAADGLTPLPGPGDIVTTGTVTRAFPVRAGEVWSSRIDGLPLAGLRLSLV